MIEAGLWGLVGGGALVLGGAVALAVRMPRQWIGLVMGLGAGVLVSALSFDLTREAWERAGGGAVTAGLAAGALAFFAGDLWVDRRGGENRKRSGPQMAGASGSTLLIGALLDGIPESVAIGAMLVEGGGAGFAFVAAVFLSNVPEAVSASTGMRAAGHSARRILGTWTAVALTTGLAAALGYALLGGAPGEAVALVQAFAAGAILTMLADTMFPEAFESSGPLVGLVTVLGFTAAFLLSTID